MIKIKELDLELFNKMRQGEEQAFTQIFNNYYEQLYQFAGRFVKKSDSAENIVQDVFVHVWINKKNINIKYNVKTYLYAAVKNHCLNFIKQNKRLSSLEDHSDKILSIKSAEEEFIKDEKIEAVNNAIEKLPGRCKRIFFMKKYDELSYKEIAEILNISINTVKTQVKRAIKSLHKQFENLSSLIIFL